MAICVVLGLTIIQSNVQRRDQLDHLEQQIKSLEAEIDAKRMDSSPKASP